MKRVERFKLLSLFGDGKQHNYWETIFLGVQYLKVHQTKFEKLMSIALEYNLLKRVETENIRLRKLQRDYVIDKRDYEYQITEKGDKALRSEQISRGGEERYYNQFDRTVDGPRGAEHFKPIASQFQKKRLSR